MAATDFDVIIIGAGPTGLSCAIECQNAGYRVLVLEKGVLTNSIYHFPMNMTFFTTPDLLEIGGIPFSSIHPKPSREEGLNYYKRVCQFYRLHVVTHCAVESVDKVGAMFHVNARCAAGSQSQFTAPAVIVATGYYDNPNLLGVSGEEQPKVKHYYDHPHSYYDKDVLIVGGKNSAVIAALELYRYGARVTVVHRGSSISEHVKYWLAPDFLNRVKEGAFPFYCNCELTNIESASVSLRNTQSGEEFTLANDYVLALTGYRPDANLLRRFGIAFDPETLVPKHNSKTLETNVSGMFVAGSISSGIFTNALFIENGRHHGATIVDSLKMLRQA